MTIRVLLADDQAMVRGGLRLILEDQPDMSVVAGAADGAEECNVNTDSHGATTLSRLLAVDWAGGTGFDHAMSRGKLMSEYLRRAAWWAQELDATREWPFFDIAAHVAPLVHAPQDLADRLETLIQSKRVRGPVRTTCLATLRWAAMLDAGVSVPHCLEDPYEPLLLMFERGGGFTTEHGFIDLVGASVLQRTWQDHRITKPVITLDQTTLDAFDAEWIDRSDP